MSWAGSPIAAHSQGKLADRAVLDELRLVQSGKGTSMRFQIGSIPGGLQFSSKIVKQHVGLVELRPAEVDSKGTRANACWHQLQHVILALQCALGFSLAEPDAQVEALCLIHCDQHIQVGLTLPKQR